MVKPREEIPHGRPLWLDQINKQVPPGAQYDIPTQIGTDTKLLRTQATSFRNHCKQLNQTTDAERDLSKHQTSLQKVPREGITSYDVKVDLVRKRNPAWKSGTTARDKVFEHGKICSAHKFRNKTSQALPRSLLLRPQRGSDQADSIPRAVSRLRCEEQHEGNQVDPRPRSLR